MSFGITYPLWMEMILSFGICGWIVSFETSVIQRHLDRLCRRSPQAMPAQFLMDLEKAIKHES